MIRPDGEKVPGPAFFDFERDEIHPASSDMHARLELLDEQGIYAQVLYPNVAGFGAQKFAEVADPELRRLCVDALQRRDGRDPGGVGRAPPADGAHAVVGRRGVDRTRCTAPRPTGCAASTSAATRRSRGAPELWQPEWEPFWEACAEHAQSVNFHIGASETSMSWFGTSPWPALDERAEARDRLGDDVPLERADHRQPHLLRRARAVPDVKFVSVESGIGWIPFFLESLDYQLYESAPSVVDELSMLPSEYFKRQVYGCFWFEHRMLEPVIDALGVTQVLFETDFPHPTCLYPDPLAWVDEALAGVDDDVKQTRAPGQRRRAVSRRASDAHTSLTDTTFTSGAAGVSSGRNHRNQMRPRGWPCGRHPVRVAGVVARDTTIVHDPSGSYVHLAAVDRHLLVVGVVRVQERVPQAQVPERALG